MSAPYLGGHRLYVQGLWGQVHVRRWGQLKAGTPTIVLCHQTPWNSVQFHLLGPELAKRGWHVIAPDTAGYGLSDPAPQAPSIEDYADNLLAVMEALSLEPCVLGGHHTGALVAATAAACDPSRVSGLMLDNPPLYTQAERHQRQTMPHRAFAPEEGGQHFGKRWAFMRDFADPALSVEALHLANVTYYLNDISADYGHAAAYRFDMESRLPDITCPAIVLSSRNDPVAAHGPRYIARRPDWQLVHMKGGSANILQRPAEWAQVCDPLRP